MDYGKIIDWAMSQGPLGVALVTSLLLSLVVWFLVKTEKEDKAAAEDVEELKKLISDYEKLTDDYHELAVNVARSMERLAVLLDERTRRQNG